MFSSATEICIFVLTLSLFLQAPLVQGQGNDEPPIVNVTFDAQGIIDSVSGLGSALGNTISNVPGQVFSVFKDSFKGSVREFNDPLLSLTEFLLSANPNPDSLFNWWKSIILIISSFYLLLFLIIGFMFLFSSINQEKRVQAKEWLKNAFLMLVGVNASFVLYKLILELSTAITKFVWVTGFEQFFESNILNGASALTLIFFSFSIGLTLITLFLRYIFLLIGVVFFPIAIFLYYIPPLKNWGKIVFNLIGIALFMQFLDVIVFVAANQLALDLTGRIGAELVTPLSFLLIGILNCILIGYAVLKSAFSISENSPIIGYAFGAITGQISTLTNALKPQGKI